MLWRQKRSEPVGPHLPSSAPAPACAARPDLLPKPYLDALSELQDRLPSFPSSIAFEVGWRALGAACQRAACRERRLWQARMVELTHVQASLLRAACNSCARCLPAPVGNRSFKRSWGGRSARSIPRSRPSRWPPPLWARCTRLTCAPQGRCVAWVPGLATERGAGLGGMGGRQGDEAAGSCSSTRAARRARRHRAAAPLPRTAGGGGQGSAAGDWREHCNRHGAAAPPGGVG